MVERCFKKKKVDIVSHKLSHTLIIIYIQQLIRKPPTSHLEVSHEMEHFLQYNVSSLICKISTLPRKLKKKTQKSDTFTKKMRELRKNEE